MSNADQRFHVSIHQGEEFQVELDSNPGSGALWYLTADSDGPRLVRQETVAQRLDIGGAAIQRFVFCWDQSGTHDLHFELKRVWESHVRRRATVTVQTI